MTAADGWCDEMSLNRFVSPPNDVQMETPYGLSPPQFIMPLKMRHCAKVDVRQGKGPTIIQTYAVVGVAQQFCENFFRLSCKLLYCLLLRSPADDERQTFNSLFSENSLFHMMGWEKSQKQLLLTCGPISITSQHKKKKIQNWYDAGLLEHPGNWAIL